MKIARIIFLLVLVLLVSCEEDDYYNFTDEEKEMFVYQEGDSFKLLGLPYSDTIIFKVKGTEVCYSSSGVPLTKTTNHYQTYKSLFVSNNIEGEFFGETSSSPTSFEFSLWFASFRFYGQLNDTIYNHTLQNKEYDELYVFSERKGKKPMLYFTKEEGIVYIDSLPDGSSYSLIEYVKGEDGLE